jgi:iron complex outermembrane receptor protein
MVISLPGVANDGSFPKRELLLFREMPVVIAAAKYEQTINEAPASVTIITSEDIERYGYRTLEEVFASVRGFYVSNDRNYSYVGVRGFSRPTDYNNRILLLLNGHTLNDRMYGSAAIGTDLALDLDSVERIEIVRGPGSALYGTNAMFAVVNIITRKGIMLNGTKLSATAGSYGRLQGRAMFGKEYDNGMDIFVSGIWSDIKGQDELYYEEYDDPLTNNGIAEDLDWDKYYAFLTTIRYSDFTLQANIKSREKGVPTGSWDTVFNNSDAKTLDKYQVVELKYDTDISVDKSIMLRGYFDRYFCAGAYPYEDDYNWSEESIDTWLGSELQFRWEPWLDNLLIVGAEYQNHTRASYKYWIDDEVSFDDDFPHNIFSLYIQDEHQAMENLSLTVGIRMDRYSTVGSSANPRVAIVYNPTRSSTLKLLYGEAFRAPSTYEANYEEEDYWQFNPDLEPEKIKTMEAVWEHWLSNRLLGMVSLYNYEMKNLIDTVELPDSLFQYQNISRVKAKGLELELNAQLTRDLRGYVSYTFQDAEDADLKEKLTNSPGHIVKLGLVCPVFKYFYAALESQYEAERITVYETETDRYLLTNINLSSKPLFDHLKFSFLIRNLFDTKYSLPGGVEHLQPAIPQNGRNFAVKLEYNF